MHISSKFVSDDPSAGGSTKVEAAPIVEGQPVNVPAFLGQPMAPLNVSSEAYQQTTTDNTRRAHKTMFNAACDDLSNGTTFGEIRHDEYFVALSTHIEADMSGPYPRLYKDGVCH